MKSLKRLFRKIGEAMYMFGDIQQLMLSQTSKFYFFSFQELVI